MNRVDFYILPESNTIESVFCVIAAKAWRQGLRIHIHSESRQDAAMLDDLLWTHDDISFLPHRMADAADPGDTPIVLGWNGVEPQTDEVLINLDTGIPGFAGGFTRIIEIVAAADPAREQARTRFREYRERGYELQTHQLTGTHASTG